MGRRRMLLTLAFLTLLLTACATPKPPAPPAPPAAPPAEAEAGPAPAPTPKEYPGWRYITTVPDQKFVHAAAPNGSAFLLVSQVMQERADLVVTLGDTIQITKPEWRKVTLPTPDHVTAAIIETPFGPVGKETSSDKGNETGTLSPDLKYMAIPMPDGLWLGDLEAGTVRRITSDAPPRPDDLPPRTIWTWAGQPSWSADSRWIYFTSNRNYPAPDGWWKVSVDGGTEQPVRSTVLADERIAWEAPAGTDPAAWAQRDGFFPRGYSPDHAWFAADKTESPMFRLYDLADPAKSVDHTDLPHRYAGWATFAPDSSKAFFHARPVYDLARFIGVIDLKAGGAVQYYAFPDPAAGLPSAWAWAGPDQLIVEMVPWNATFTDRAYPETSHDWWILDLRKAVPAEPQEPTRVLSARPWGATTTGAEEASLDRDTPLVFHFDTPVSDTWLREHIQIEGTGAILETADAALGLAAVNIKAGQPDETVRIRVPALGFDLLVRRRGPFTAAVEVRPEGGDWQKPDPTKLLSRGSLDLRFRFNHPVDQEKTAAAVVEALRKGWYESGLPVLPVYGEALWEDGALVVHVPAPPARVMFSLYPLKDAYGLPMTNGIPPMTRAGDAPYLVALGADQETVIATVPLDVAAAALSKDGKGLLLSRWKLNLQEPAMPFVEQLQHERLDLATGRIEPAAPPPGPDPVPAGTACNLSQARNLRISWDSTKALYNRMSDWEDAMIMNLTTCEIQHFGRAFPVGWDSQGRPLLIRWADSPTRFIPRFYK
jgi:hypothetical protein